MFPSQFEYHRATSPDDAVATLAKYGGDARILAGGQSLIPAMRYRLARPAVLIDINPLQALSYVRDDGGRFTIGACARDVMLERSDMVRTNHPLVADVSAVVADPVVRQMGTVVGSLCHNDPAGDWPVAALAARAEIAVRGPHGDRTVPIDEFLVDSYTTALAPDEMALEVRFPAGRAGSSGAFVKIERKVGDFATASAAASIALGDDGTIVYAGIAIGAVGSRALRVPAAESMLRGARPSIDLIRGAAEEAKRVADPVADNRGTAAYKREMAGVLVGRALRRTFERLGIGGMQ